MLVLDRKVQEGFWIGGQIFVKVLGVGRRRVKLGIEAPADINIVRGELYSNGGAPVSLEGSPVHAHDDAQGSLRSVRRRE